MLDIAAETNKKNNIYLINLRGRIDSGTARDFETFFESLLEEGHRYLLLESSGLEFVSSAGIAALVRLIRRLESLAGAGAFVGLNEEIGMVLDFFKLSEYLPFFADIEAGRNHLSDRINRLGVSLEMSRSEELEPVATPIAPKTVPVPEPEVGPRPILSNGQGKNFTQEAEPASVSAIPVTAIEPEQLTATIQKTVRETVLDIMNEQQAAREVKRRRQAQRSEAVSEAKTITKPKATVEPEGVSVSEPTPEPVPVDSVLANEPIPREGLAAYLARETRSHSGPVSVLEKPVPVPVSMHEYTSIIACRKCGNQLRIRDAGKYQCPACSIMFVVSAEGGVSYLG